MSVTVIGDVVETQLWPQGDIRDPLGVWGSRTFLQGDATGGGNRCQITIPAERRSAYVYTCYHAQISALTGTPIGGSRLMCRLLTNWPNISADPGVQGFSTNRHAKVNVDVVGFIQTPLSGIDENLLMPQDRFILLYDPRQQGDAIVIVELTLNDNVDLDTMSFEAYGYYWDRSVMDAPGGPRHPGSA